MNQQKISIQKNNPKRGSVATSVEEAKKTVIEFIDEDTVSITVVQKDSESKPKRASLT